MSTTFRRAGGTGVPDRVIVGGALITFGALLLLQQAGYATAGKILSGWWPIVIVILGAAHLAAASRLTLGPLIAMLFGLALLAGTLEVVPGGALALFWPFVLVVFGVSLVARRAREEARETSDENHLRLDVAWGGVTHVSRARRFQSANLHALCGGIVLDLRNAVLDPAGATIHAAATCGGIEIRVPVGWQVELSGAPIIGGYDMKALDEETPPPDAPRLRVEVAALMGGVTIKH